MIKQYDIDTMLTETKRAAGKLKAISNVFSAEYVDNSDFHMTAMQIETSPEKFSYLFSAIEDLVYDLYEMIGDLEEKILSSEDQKTA